MHSCRTGVFMAPFGKTHQAELRVYMVNQLQKHPVWHNPSGLFLIHQTAEISHATQNSLQHSFESAQGNSTLCLPNPIPQQREDLSMWGKGGQEIQVEARGRAGVQGLLQAAGTGLWFQLASQWQPHRSCPSQYRIPMATHPLQSCF